MNSEQCGCVGGLGAYCVRPVCWGGVFFFVGGIVVVDIGNILFRLFFDDIRE